ncbi:MAG: hypothetical protein ABIJ21_03790 [Nanoarchaeota archaeon]
MKRKEVQKEAWKAWDVRNRNAKVRVHKGSLSPIPQMRSWMQSYCLHAAILLFVLLFAGMGSAIPPLPTEFYGSVKVYNDNASTGLVIRVYDPGAQQCGRFTTVNSGYYGVLSCMGDWEETNATDEGAGVGNVLNFTFDSLETSLIGDPTYEPGTFKRVDIVVPKLVCGDGFCDSLESQQTCPDDCGAPPANETPGGGGDEGQGEAGAGGGSGAGGGAGAGAAANQPASTKSTCEEKWLCTEWGDCQSSGVQTRNCTEMTDCNTDRNKPLLSQECFYVPTCFDGIMNGLETGVDCGGPCPPCAHCFDRIQNYGELAVDCGGPCPACPSCADGMRNQGESGVDCGGPCQACKTIFELPRLVCVRMVDPFNPYFIFIASLLFLVLVGRVVSSELKVRRIKMRMQDEPAKSRLKRVLKISRIRRRTFRFIMSILLVALVTFLYYYFIGICYQLNLLYLWVFILALVLIPVVVHFIMKRYEYDEKKRLDGLRLLADTHYKQITDLISLQNAHLLELEHEIADEIVQVQKSPEYAELFRGTHSLKKVYSSLLALFDKYKKSSTPFAEERLLLSELRALLESQEYVQQSVNHPRIQAIGDRLKQLYTIYEQKQELYEALDRLDADEDGKEGVAASGVSSKTAEEQSEQPVSPSGQASSKDLSTGNAEQSPAKEKASSGSAKDGAGPKGQDHAAGAAEGEVEGRGEGKTQGKTGGDG